MRARVVVEHDLLQHHDQPADIARLAGLSQAIEPRLDIALRHAVAYEDADLLMGSGRGILARGIQLFIELLARAHAGELDLYVLLRLQPRQQDQVPGQIHDLDRISHLQDADLAAFSNERGLQHELTRFRNRHEEAAHVRVRYGHRYARHDLFLK